MAIIIYFNFNGGNNFLGNSSEWIRDSNHKKKPYIYHFPKTYPLFLAILAGIHAKPNQIQLGLYLLFDHPKGHLVGGIQLYVRKKLMKGQGLFYFPLYQLLSLFSLIQSLFIVL